MVRIISTVTPEQAIQLEGEIIAADFETSTGKILVFENNHLKEDIYSFEVERNALSRNIFREAFLNEVSVKCRLLIESGIVELCVEQMELR